MSTVSKNQTLATEQGEYLVTAVRNGSVYGVPTKTVDEAGTAGNEAFLGSVEEVESGARGQLYDPS